MIKVGMISLGCPKNQVDAEVMLGALVQDPEMTVTSDMDDMDVVIVNTCGFIESAKQEAIENILEMCQLKAEGAVRKVIVTGCLAQRYKDEILTELPEVDAVVGLTKDCDIVSVVKSVLDNGPKDYWEPFSCLTISGPRMVTTPPQYAYLKIAEGCDNHCTYCAIPMIRGKFVSRPMEELVEEARVLAENGAKELIVVAQDTTRYGYDLQNGETLAKLLLELNKIDSLRWIRILYCYPEGMTDELIDVLAGDNKILPYVDLPLQHVSDTVLKRMNRPITGEQIRVLIKKLRTQIPDLELRTTMLTGFPGETEEDFEQLTAFIEETGFQKLGCFAYSQEEGTPAARLKDQLDEELKQHRAELVMTCQTTVLESLREARIGQTTEIMIESESDDGIYAAREWRDAPEIDFTVWLECDEKLHPGDIVTAKLTELTDCEYTAILA